MEEDFEVFDFQRIFFGDAPLLFLLEIVFRTVIMFGYTTFLLRILGKRGMGQLSSLELAIIIAFGTAVGDPMLHHDVPVLHGMVAITVVTLFQIGLERFINKNKKVEAYLEGEPNLVVDDGLMKWDCLLRDNLSKEDLFRALRDKEVEHLGQIDKAFFETSGRISVLFKSPKKVKPGLTTMPENIIPRSQILTTGKQVPEAGLYCCLNCGNLKCFDINDLLPVCELCEKEQWIKADS